MPDMSPDMTGDDLLAAEFALGLLSEAEARAAAARVAREAAFAEAVEWWRDELGTLGADPVAPPPGLWRAIELRLAANDDGPPLAAAGATVRRWRLATAAMSAIAAVLLSVIVLRPPAAAPVGPATQPRPLSAPLVASVSGKRGDAVAIAFDRDTRALIVTPTVLAKGRGDAELWVIPVGAAKPVAIGVIDARAPSRFVVPGARAALLREGATVAISLEPEGGSPTGQPTGPVIATGKIVGV